MKRVGTGPLRVALAVVVFGARSVLCCASPCVAVVVPVLALSAVQVAPPKTKLALPLTAHDPGVRVMDVMFLGVAVVRLVVSATRTVPEISSPGKPAALVSSVAVGNGMDSSAVTTSDKVVEKVR